MLQHGAILKDIDWKMWAKDYVPCKSNYFIKNLELHLWLIRNF